MLLKFLATEKQHLNQVGEEGKTLLFSFFLYYICDPILWTFITAFLWRISKSTTVIAVYDISIFLGISIGYFINIKLLNRFRSSKLYLLGVFSQGFIVVLLIFLSSASLYIVFVLGLIFGLTSSLFWLNKALLSYNFTHMKNRLYFSGIDWILINITAIFVPFVVGWYIVLGNNFNLYTPTAAYKILAFFVLFILFLSGFVVRKIVIPQEKVSNFFLKNPGKDWNRIRFTTFILGVVNGAEVIIPTVIVLIFVGQEGKLGTIQSLAAILTSIAIYITARKGRVEHRIFVFGIGIIFSIISSSLFSAFYSAIGVVLYFLLSSFSTTFRWSIYNPITYDLIEKSENNINKSTNFFADQELFLTIGRNLGLVIFIAISFISYEISIRYTLLIFALFQIPLVLIIKGLEKSMKSHFSGLRTPPVIQPESL